MLVLALIVVSLGSATIERFEDQTGLTTTVQKQTAITKATAISIAASNYGFVAIRAQSNTTLLGNFTVLAGGRVSIIVLWEDAFAKWRTNQSAEVLFFTQPSRNGTFSFQPHQAGTYYFIVINADPQRLTVVLSMHILENIRVPMVPSNLAGPFLFAIGSITTGLGVWHENRRARYRRNRQLLRLAQSPGINIWASISQAIEGGLSLD